MLNKLVFAINMNHADSVQYSPYYLVFGRLPVLPVEVQLGQTDSLPTTSRASLRDMLQNQATTHAHAGENILNSQT